MSEETLKATLQSVLSGCEEDTVDYLVSTAFTVFEEHKHAPKAVKAELSEAVGPFLEDMELDADAQGKVIDAIVATLLEGEGSGGGEGGDDDDIVYIPKFLLAYLGNQLLEDALLRLKRGHIYGIIGKNGIGKTTLLRKMSLNDVPGFPRPEQVHCTYVQHEVVPETAGQTALEFCKGEKQFLEEVGFSEERLRQEVAKLSGGWRMRLALARAMTDSSRTDVLLLDEPTNHLDPSAVKWLVSYLLRAKERMAVVLVSHDPEFMDACCTDIIHYHSLQLNYYPGKFSHFQAQRPDDAAVVLSAKKQLPDSMVFNFPKPGRLDGIKSDTKSVLRLKNVNFKYSQDGPIVLRDVTCRLTLGSRVCLIGSNGAGKSTMLGIMNGDLELQPGTGELFRHHNLRVAYIAQHHVHHLRQHLDTTPVLYFMDRFKTGIDRETVSVSAMQESSFEAADRVLKAKQHGKMGSGVELLVGRRKDGKELWYEVKWEGLSDKFNEWVSKSFLEEKLGVKKLVAAFDVAIAQRVAGVDQRPLTSEEILAHLKDFGLSKQFAEGKIAGLSGGQRSRLTLAAALWTRPHLIILDEPTNYLDLDALGALEDAIHRFRGGVLVVSHNRQFTGAIASETWSMEEGVLDVLGSVPEASEEEDDGGFVTAADDATTAAEKPSDC